MAKKADRELPFEVRRVAQRRKVSLFFGTSKTPVIAYVTNLSMTGMFVEVAEPPEPTAILRFEMVMAGGFEVVRGRAQVVWVRSPSTVDSAGIGLRFFKLEPRPAKILRELVSKEVSRQRDLGAPSLRDAVGDTLSKVGDSSGLPEPARTLRRRRSTSTFSAITVLAVVVVIGLLLWSSFGHESQPLEWFSELIGQSRSAAEDNDPREIGRRWARAFSERRVDDLLALYSESFEPSDQRTRDEWEESVRSELAAARDRPLRWGPVSMTKISERRFELSFELRDPSTVDAASVHSVALTVDRESVGWVIVGESRPRATGSTSS